MLDTLAEAWAANHGGANIWADKTVKFLDPCTKSGVFLREITSRLTKGLEQEIPNLEKRVNHILTKQVFGIGITQITSLLARRSVYCSKHANGKHSIAKRFASDDGNIWFKRIEHTWDGRQVQVLRRSERRLRPGGGTGNPRLRVHSHRQHQDSARRDVWRQYAIRRNHRKSTVPTGRRRIWSKRTPIYQLFVEQAMSSDPRYAAMVIPSRWMAGGRGLDDFRKRCLSDNRIRNIVDYPDSSTRCFQA